MALQFEGVPAGVSEKQQQFIREVLQKRGFENNKVVFEPAGKAGDNFVATVLRITVIVQDGNDFKMIAKVAPQLEAVRTGMNTSYLFNNEIIMYEQVLPKFKSLQEEAGVSENEILRYAHCYGCLSEEPNEVILLEDLKPLDYVMLDRRAPMSNEAVLLVLKNFATIHSMSYVLKHLEPETYENFSNRLTDVWKLMANEDQMMFLAQVEQSALEVLDDEEYKKYIRGVVSQMNALLPKIKKHENPKYLIIQQGDSWTNNIMFQLDEGKPSNAIMIDYQLANENSPVADLLYFVFCCTDHAIRSEHYQDWISFYHDQLDKSLSNFGLKANYIYPKDQLDADLKRYSKLFLGSAVLLQSMLMRSPEEAAQMHEAMTKFDVEKLEGMPVETLSGDTIALFKSALHGLIDSYRQFGYVS
ncbi:uncharacterized protein LOC114366171 [Ostrinia furnacalis]|uniref:uncharacterized protein LOC114366171 n=1 Tax=Ostrinia furnacalis TaxID=93504 RepID=UPI001040A378|nr:uncharacterized protein LOC114366171 [Ostrinia furnacalis]